MRTFSQRQLINTCTVQNFWHNLLGPRDVYLQPCVVLIIVELGELTYFALLLLRSAYVSSQGRDWRLVVPVKRLPNCRCSMHPVTVHNIPLLILNELLMIIALS